MSAPKQASGKPSYVYVASSWRNPMQPAVIRILKAAGIAHYDFRNPEGGTGFSWQEVKPNPLPGIPGKGSDWETQDDYLAMIAHPRAIEGFEADFAAMQKADTFVMVLPCGKSAHLELGWAIGAGKRTAILLEDPVEPELMYRMADYLAPNVMDLLGWLGVETRTVRIPACDEHEGRHAVTVTALWECPVCGGPRGEPKPAVSYDGSRRLHCDGWTNPCGHVDLYSAVRKEVVSR